MKTAFLSALGAMGRRHLRGLVHAGFSVTAYDINDGLQSAVKKELLASGLTMDKVFFTSEIPAGNFDVAIFAETTTNRLQNFKKFLSHATISRILLEKPMSADPDEVRDFHTVALAHAVVDITQVNFVRRHWPHLHTLAALCAQERQFTVTLNGGAIGMGCMGIHYLDSFLALCGDEIPDVIWSDLSKTFVASGRGSQFIDFGCDFVLAGTRARLMASLEAGSSANVVMTVRGAHFIAQVDYTDLSYKISARKSDCILPNYRYGAEYAINEGGNFSIPEMHEITQSWAINLIQMPGLVKAIKTHDLLDRILQAGGAKSPYQYT